MEVLIIVFAVSVTLLFRERYERRLEREGLTGEMKEVAAEIAKELDK